VPLAGRASSNSKGVDFRHNGRELLKSPNLLSIRPSWEGALDTITDISDTMHVTAIVNARLEATAPWGLCTTPRTCWIIRKHVVRARLGNIRIHFEVENDACLSYPQGD
jgi:hypothetical protein